MNKREKAPLVSVIVANYNGESYLEDALNSALNQTLSSIEVIFVDDCSSDNSVELARVIAEKDARLEVVALPQNGGPSRARNEALRHARGEWIAILDSDDLMHPYRLDWLYSFAHESAADIVADDLLVFYSNLAKPHSFLGADCVKAFTINAVDYVSSNHMSGAKRNSLGFLKPMIRRSALLEHNISYDESLDNSEDYELILQLLLQGATYSVSPFLGYFYRKHDESISHRSGRGSLVSLLKADDRLSSSLISSQEGLSLALKERRRSIHNAVALLDVVDALKSKNPKTILNQFFHSPSSFLLLCSVIRDKWNRRFIKHSVSDERKCGTDDVLLIFSEDSKRSVSIPKEEMTVCELEVSSFDSSVLANPRALKAEAILVAVVIAQQPKAIVIGVSGAEWVLPFTFQLKAPRYGLEGVCSSHDSITLVSGESLSDILI